MRKGLVVTLSSAALLVFGCVEAPPDDVLTGSADLDDAQLAKAASEIIGGATTSGYPAVGALTYDGEPFCTGTVIAPRKVVTAAHCVVDMLPREVKFVLGANAYSPDTVLSVSALRAHPYYDDWSLDNDIGLVTLAADAPVAPVGLLGDMDGSFIGERFIFVGFGVSNGYRQTGAGVKRAVTIPIAEVAPTQFTTTAAGVNTCSGDSGGPAFYTHPSGTLLLAGTTSYGDEYCVEYGTDMRVDPYLSFLGVAAWTPPAPDAGEGEGEGAEGEGEAAEGEGEGEGAEGEGEGAEGEGEGAEPLPEVAPGEIAIVEVYGKTLDGERQWLELANVAGAPRELAGCVVMFAAIVLAQAPDLVASRKDKRLSRDVTE